MIHTHNMKTLLSFNEAVNFDVDNWNIQQEVDMFNNVLSQWNMLKKSINNKLRDGEKLNIDGKEWDVKIETYNSGKYVWIRNSENVLFEFKIKKNKIVNVTIKNSEDWVRFNELL